MYADHVESGKKRSIRDRLDGDVGGGFGRSRLASGKRQRQSDDKWKHDLYADRGGPQISKARVDAEDLRVKLQKKTPQKTPQRTRQGGKESGVQDRSGKLAGDMPPSALSKAKRVPEPPTPLIAKRVPEPSAPPKVKRMPDPPAPVKTQLVSEIAKPVKKSIVSVEETVLDTKKVPASTSSRKKSQKKAGLSVDDLLKSLGLEKYSITFQVEEVDMAALRHMTEDDLKVLGIPMGPRKKILLALNTKA